MLKSFDQLELPSPPIPFNCSVPVLVVYECTVMLAIFMEMAMKKASFFLSVRFGDDRMARNGARSRFSYALLRAGRSYGRSAV